MVQTYEQHISSIHKQIEQDKKDNMDLLNSRLKKYYKRELIQEGDWIIDKYTYDMSRVTEVWKDEHDVIFQIQTEGDYTGRYYFRNDGTMSYSGGLSDGYEIPKWKFRKLDYKKKGSVWIFKRDIHIADNDIEYTIPCKVWEAY